MRAISPNSRRDPSACTHAHVRYVRFPSNGGGYSIAPQCAECGQLVKLPQHHFRVLIKRFEVPTGSPIVDIRADEVTRHG